MPGVRSASSLRHGARLCNDTMSSRREDLQLIYSKVNSSCEDLVLFSLLIHWAGNPTLPSVTIKPNIIVQ